MNALTSFNLATGFESRRRRHRLKGLVLVVGLHVLVAYAALSGGVRSGLHLIKPPLQAAVIQEVLLPPPPPPPPPVTKEVKPPESSALSAPPVPQPALHEISLPPTAPAAASPPEPAPPWPAVLATAIPSPATEVPKSQTLSLQDEYLGRIRVMLNATKRYPTGRQASQSRPQGKVRVWFTLSRSGSLLDAGVLESSNSNLLDDAALATVRRATYPAFPSDTWPGQEQHKFSAEIEFRPPSAD